MLTDAPCGIAQRSVTASHGAAACAVHVGICARSNLQWPVPPHVTTQTHAPEGDAAVSCFRIREATRRLPQQPPHAQQAGSRSTDSDLIIPSPGRGC